MLDRRGRQGGSASWTLFQADDEQIKHLAHWRMMYTASLTNLRASIIMASPNGANTGINTPVSWNKGYDPAQ
jgi:hypothetical protein